MKKRGMVGGRAEGGRTRTKMREGLEDEMETGENKTEKG